MFLSVASALIYVGQPQRRLLIDVFPPSVRNLWNDWELRVLIVLSLTLQIVQLLLGSRRKYIARTRIRFTLWISYLMADWVAIVALGVITRYAQKPQDKPGTGPGSRTVVDDDSSSSIAELMSFWAPFLLMHLGGPDTITAYSLEDNELWLRHLVGLVIQSGAAVYIVLMVWPGSSWLPILSVLILNAGLIKYGQRTFALRSANSQHFRDSLLTPPDPGPNYPKFMDEFTLKKAEGFYVEAAEVIEIPDVPTDDHPYPDARGKLISEAHDLFHTFKRLFVDLILSFQHKDSSISYFEKLDAEAAFHVVEVELGFAFDALYTKAPVAYTLVGCISRLVSFSSIFTVLVGFVLFCDRSNYHKIDLIITYLLLIGAILLEIYSVYVLLLSDWTDHWLRKHNITRDILIIHCLRQPKKLWWSNLMPQYNLLSVCFGDRPAVWYRIQKLLQMDEFREKHRYKTYSAVTKDLKVLIFQSFKKFTNRPRSDPRTLCTSRGIFALEEHGCSHSLDWSITKVEFDHSILIWHIATDLCYYFDGGENRENSSNPNCKESKPISDYMLYLLVMCPFMLPIGIGLIRFRDTCAEAREFFEGKSPMNKAEACEKLRHVNTEVLPAKVKGDRSKSVLFDACRLAKWLQTNKNKEEKWKVVSDVWVEMLAYAATHCRGNHHAQQLRKGGELLTHVWLLMAHLGITEQFQIDQGHARAKLIVK